MYKTVDKTIYKQAFNPDPLIRCWNECLDKSSFHIRRTRVDEFNKKSYWKKRGIAIVPMKFSVGFAATSYHQVKFTHTRMCHVVNNPYVQHNLGPITDSDVRGCHISLNIHRRSFQKHDQLHVVVGERSLW